MCGAWLQLHLRRSFLLNHNFTLTLNLTLNKPTTLVSLFPLSIRNLLQPQDWCIQTNEQTTRCRTEVATAVAVVVEEVEDTQMGTMTIQATFLVELQEVETILQPIPVGMIIQGLEVAV